MLITQEIIDEQQAKIATMLQQFQYQNRLQHIAQQEKNTCPRLLARQQPSTRNLTSY